MSMKSQKEAIEDIQSSSRRTKGKTYSQYYTYLGTNTLTKQQVRLYAPTKDGLIEKIKKFYKDLKDRGEVAFVLTPPQLLDARIALYKLSEMKLNISLTNCVERIISQISAVSCVDKSLGDAYDEYMKSKKDNSYAEKRKTGATVGRFVNAIGQDVVVNTITLADVRKYLLTFYENKAPRTFNANLSYVRTFFKWCLKPSQRYVTQDPTIGLDEKPIMWKKPQYLHPIYVEKLLRILEGMKKEVPECLALAITQLFVGVRREEAIRIGEDSNSATIIIEDETFRVDKGKGHTRGKAPRTAHLEKNAIAWMKCFDYENALNLINRKTTARLYEIAKANDIPIFNNCMRHTFITMHVAKYHTPEVTQSMVGTSGSMRAAHYDGLAPQKEGEYYFNIFPTQCE